MFRCKCCGAINRTHAAAPDVALATCGRCHESLDLSGAPQPVDAAALAQTLSSSPVPVLVDFWTPQCQANGLADPTVDKVAREQAGTVITLTVNAQAEPVPAIVHGVQRPFDRGGSDLPTLVLFRRGCEIARRSGVPPGAQLQQWLAAASAG